MAKKEIIVISQEPLANCDRFSGGEVENRIFTIRGVQVILDRDLAELYGVKTYRLNEQVKRNIKRFPERYRFQLTEEETNELIANCDRFETLKHSSFCPYAFTEHGVVMLSAVLHSEEAIDISGRIVDAFVAMRRFLAANAPIFQRLEHIEYKLLENDHKFDQVFAKLEEKTLEPQQGIFFEGQVFDAYQLICELIKSATSRIILIDNYVDESVLTMLDKRPAGVSASIFTQKISQQLSLDIAKHDAQYPPIPVHVFSKSHDRFLIIDDRVYHVGASIKDLGKKWFAILEMEDQNPDELISRL
ncbi:MAG: ORF6N domain-containing protein [Bacteroidales bacterium]|nr:ORF6N domain-containing protein [Bacteroidales bacterium]